MTTPQTITRAEAKAQGLTYYYTGKACKWKHVAIRRAVNGDCMGCIEHKSKTFWPKGIKIKSISLEELKTLGGLSRQEARKKGSRHYLVVGGKRCPYDHDSKRDTKGGSCFMCSTISALSCYYKNQEEYSQRSLNYHHENREARLQYRAKWLAKLGNRKKLNEAGLQYYEDHKEECQANHKEWLSENKHRIAFYSAKRRARIARQSPPMTEEEAQILQLFARAKLLQELDGVEYHIDHIRPLSKGGAHHPCNLQVIPALNNLKKKDKWDGKSGVGYDEFMKNPEKYRIAA